MSTHRRCGSCTLCCKLVPVTSHHEREEQLASLLNVPIGPRIDKPAGQKCPHQCASGCKIYDERPFSCRMWSCRWLNGADTEGMRRPDRVHYVIDCMPDYVTMHMTDGSAMKFGVVQVWIDPDHPQAWRHDPSLLAYMKRRGREGIATIIRFNSRDAVVWFYDIDNDRFVAKTGDVEARNANEAKILAMHDAR
jgi:hypothetical protein